jgi:hypothetical protein
MFDTMRFTGATEDGGLSAGAKSKLGGIVERTLGMGLDPFTIAGMREAGFRAMQGLIDSDSFRAAAPLPTTPDPTVVFDGAVLRVGMDRLQFVADLISEGLTFSLPDPLSVPFLGWRTRGRSATARRVMNPAARGENSLATMGEGRLPIYLTMADNQIGIRELRMSQRIGIPLDTANIEDDTRAVNEAIEDAGVNGATTLDGQALKVLGYDAPGLLNAPNANTKSLSLADWTTTPNGTNIMLAITQMLAQLTADKMYGPYNLYIPTATGIAWNLDFKANGNDSVMARIQQIQAGGRPLRIRPLDSLPSNKAAMVQMTSNVVDVIDGQRPTVIPFTSLDGFTLYNLVMAIMIPRFRSDSDGNSGVVVGTMS